MNTAAMNNALQAVPLESARGVEDVRRRRRVAAGNGSNSPSSSDSRVGLVVRLATPGGAPPIPDHMDETPRLAPETHTPGGAGRWDVIRRILLPLLGLAVAGATIQIGLLAAEIRRPGSIPLRAELAGYPLAEERDGGLAVKAMDQPGTGRFPIVSASSGVYGEPSQLTLWVGDNSTPLASQLMFRSMARNMGKEIASRSGSFPTIDVQGDALVFHGTQKCGYLYRTGNRVVWLRVNSSIAQRAISEIREYYP